jgi:hypothetical protein
MFAVTITITDRTQTPQNLYTLITKGSQTGYTVAPAAGIAPSNLTQSQTGCVSYLSIQASYKNGGTTVYKGDENVKNDGSRQAKELNAGDTDVQQAYSYSTNLNEIYLTASANAAVVNVEFHYA